MSDFLFYILKLSVSFAVVFLFYHFLLRKLTFYNWNRWFLVLYTILCFFIPLINISPVLEQRTLDDSTIIRWVPLLQVYKNSNQHLTAESFFIAVFLAGALVMLFRLMIQFLSFKRLMTKATLLSSEGMRIYHVNDNIIPFSFGNSIFINQNLHSKEELLEIIRHEFVHVKQKHSADIIWTEILCVLNWYNPFVWLIKKATRQNLEFIADNKVLQGGIPTKEYQYMLLKVVGNNQFSIAQQFNFSSLKKRIAMMNKNKSAKINLVRFLFVLPVIAVLLVSFRKQISDTLTGKQGDTPIAIQPADTVPPVKTLNSKGYFIDIIDASGNCEVLIRDKNRKEVQKVLLNDWLKKQELYEGFYGEILPPPPPTPPIPPAPPAPTGSLSKNEFLEKHTDVENIGWVFNNDNTVAVVHIINKDGKEIEYDLRNKEQRNSFESKYGYIVVPDLPTPPAPPPVPVVLPERLNKPDALLTPYEKIEKERLKNMKPGEGC